MIIDHQTISLYGKVLFERVTIKPPSSKVNPMPNEACFLHIVEGGYNSISENDFLTIKTGQSVLMKCGNYLSQMIPDSNTGLHKAFAVHFYPEVLKKVYQNELPKFLSKQKENLPKGMGTIPH